MESQARIHTRTGWDETEADRLFSAVQEANASGRPLQSVFNALAVDLGRKPNSIRNYYYTQMRTRIEAARRMPAYTAFTPEETHELLRKMLIAQGKGVSVRACAMEMGQGSHSRMLRYQNKYRALIKRRPALVAQVCQELRQEGLPCPAPTAIDQADAAFCDPDNAAAARLMAEPCVAHLLEGLKELLRRAARSEEAGELQQALDRLRVQQDLRRIAWEKDYEECLSKLEELMGLVKEFLALGEAEMEEGVEAFRRNAVVMVSGMEEFATKHRALAG